MKANKPIIFSIVTRVYNDLIVKKYRDQSFWILSAFIPTFIGARLLVRLDPRIFFTVNGSHVHHFTYGFLILAIAGFIAIVRPGKPPAWLAALYGVGLALAVDEAGMWLHLTNFYYNETSENALVIVLALLINLVYFRAFWLGLVREALNAVKRI